MKMSKNILLLVALMGMSAAHGMELKLDGDLSENFEQDIAKSIHKKEGMPSFAKMIFKQSKNKWVNENGGAYSRKFHPFNLENKYEEDDVEITMDTSFVIKKQEEQTAYQNKTIEALGKVGITAGFNRVTSGEDFKPKSAFFAKITGFNGVEKVVIEQFEKSPRYKQALQEYAKTGAHNDQDFNKTKAYFTMLKTYSKSTKHA